ncbi:MAG: DoxX family protein [Phycisphaerae bacterium]|nr:DoxX family protein [Phycisphaerae bacterium]
MTRHSLASLVSPVFLRLVLAVTFFWAGLGKVVATSDYSGDDAATLKRWNITSSGSPTTPAPTNAPTPPTTPTTPTTPTDPPADGASAGEPAPAEPATDSIRAPRLYHIALMIERMARTSPPPPATIDSTPTPPTPELRRTIPAFAADGRTPVVLAWSAAICEIAAGVCCFIGLLTRLAALSLAGVMATAIWLTQIGPAYASGSAMFGFLPRHETFDTAAWQPLLWQVSLLGASLALLFAGPGLISLDRLFFHRPHSATRPATSAGTPA